MACNQAGADYDDYTVIDDEMIRESVEGWVLFIVQPWTLEPFKGASSASSFRSCTIFGHLPNVYPGTALTHRSSWGILQVRATDWRIRSKRNTASETFFVSTSNVC